MDALCRKRALVSRAWGYFDFMRRCCGNYFVSEDTVRGFVRQGALCLALFYQHKPCIPTLPREHPMASHSLLLEQWINFIPGEIALRQHFCIVLYDNLTIATAQASAHRRGERENKSAQLVRLINESQPCSICCETGNWKAGYFYDPRAASHLCLAPNRVCSPLSHFWTHLSCADPRSM